jgi:hypothetical protein
MIRPHIWDADVQTAFSPILYDGGALWKSVQLGEAQLWRVEESDCSGFLATQVYDDMLFVHCFAGRGTVPLMRRLAVLAKSNGLSKVGFFSLHHAARRVFGRFAEMTDTPLAGETRYFIDAELLCALPKTLADPSPSAR